MVSLLVFLFSLSSSFSFFLLCVGVRGSARAAMRARTLSPNTIVSFLVVFSLLFAALRLSVCPAFLFVGMAVWGSPCVAVFGWHDCDG